MMIDMMEEEGQTNLPTCDSEDNSESESENKKFLNE
jgi:hypothetical protein